METNSGGDGIDTREALSARGRDKSRPSIEPVSPLPTKDDSDDHLDNSLSAQGSCQRCSEDGIECARPGNEIEAGCLRCKNIQITCSWTQAFLNKASKPRILNRLKCEFCRQSKQACLPTDREWNDSNPVKCHRCIQKGLPCSKPSTKNPRSVGDVNDIHISDPPIPKKRGRPSKADADRARAEAIVKGVIMAQKTTMGNKAPQSGHGVMESVVLDSSQGLLSADSTSPRASAKRNRPITREDEQNDRIPSQSVPRLGERVHQDASNQSVDAAQLLGRTLAHQSELSPVLLQALLPTKPGSPLRFSTLASDIDTSSGASSRRTSDDPRIARLRARANWFRAADAIRKEYQIKKITSYLTEITWGSSRILCSICESMNLTAAKFSIPRNSLAVDENQHVKDNYSLGPRSNRGILSLGLLTEIQKRSYKCPFCKLVLFATQGQTEIDLSDGRSYPDMVCLVGWQLDGYERNLKGDALRPRTRRICLHWTAADFQDTYIVRVAEANTGLSSDHLFLGRELQLGTNDPPLDLLPLMKSWINVCNDHHGDTCAVSDALRFEDMRSRPYFGVVDVQDMKLTSLPPCSRYAVLSYTWGKATAFATQKAHITALQALNGVGKHLHRFPKAVKEAIGLVKDLGERYIWIDCLCIVQDSRDSLQLNLNMMDQIYGNAHFTICAADDPDATAGLVALDPTKRRAAQRLKQRIEQYAPGLRLMVSQLTESYVRKSRWSQRAWTLQEVLLSRRCLTFTHGQVFFQCRTTAMSEDIWSDSPDAGWSIELAKSSQQMLSSLPERALQTYARVVEKYTGRNLDSKDDILSAFNGISNALSTAIDGNFIYGMPDIYFDWALLWEPRYHPKRRIQHSSHKKRDSRELKPITESMFPSWSWSGWLGIMHYIHAVCSLSPQDLHEWFLQHTWIIWYIRDSRGRLRLIRQPSSNTQILKQSEMPDDESAEKSLSENRHCDLYGRVRRYPLHDSTPFTRTLPDFPYSIETADPQEKPDALQRDLKFLQFFTWGAHFSLSCDDPDKPKHLHRFDIFDNKGDWCGTVMLRKDWINKIKKEPVRKFIALSDAKSFTSEECEVWNHYVPKAREASIWDLFHVMLIEEDDEGIAERVGIGKVFMGAFEHSYRGKKQWSEFILG